LGPSANYGAKNNSFLRPEVIDFCGDVFEGLIGGLAWVYLKRGPKRSGNRVVIAPHRFDGKVVKRFANRDDVRTMQQLGLIPPPPLPFGEV
jgi:hypothetical protein